MKSFPTAVFLAALATVAATPLHANPASVPIRFENSGIPVEVKQFRDGVQCDLSPRGRGILTIGASKRLHLRTQFDEHLVAGEPVEFVFVRKVQRPARIGLASADAFGVRTRLLPLAGNEYRVRIVQQSTQVDAVVEARAIGSNAAFERAPVEVSYDVRDLCVSGTRTG